MPDGPQQPGSVDGLLQRVDEGWAWFSRAAQALDPDAWDDEVPGGGWTRRKMLNHIRVWHEITAQRLAAFHATGERSPSPGDDDVINAQAAADADLRSREMILEELDESYRRLCAEIAQLVEAQLSAHDGWTVAVVAGNTWEHYEEHRADLAE